MPNSVFAGTSGVQVNDSRGSHVTFASGKAEIDPTDTDLVASVEAQGAKRVDFEGTSEALTPGTVQTATTLSAIDMLNAAAPTVLNIRALNATGTLLVGPITIAANARRIIVFPTELTATGGVFIDVDSGGLHATTPGFLLP